MPAGNGDLSREALRMEAIETTTTLLEEHNRYFKAKYNGKAQPSDEILAAGGTYIGILTGLHADMVGLSGQVLTVAYKQGCFTYDVETTAKLKRTAYRIASEKKIFAQINKEFGAYCGGKPQRKLSDQSDTSSTSSDEDYEEAHHAWTGAKVDWVGQESKVDDFELDRQVKEDEDMIAEAKAERKQRHKETCQHSKCWSDLSTASWTKQCSTQPFSDPSELTVPLAERTRDAVRDTFYHSAALT
eukprot:scaffold10177_cov40-Prasinocladus_malaysianus.AAC.1